MRFFLLQLETTDWIFKIIDISVALGIALVILYFAKKMLDGKDVIIKAKDEEIAKLFETSKEELKESLKIYVRLQDFIDNKEFRNVEKFDEIKTILNTGFDRISRLINDLSKK